MEPVGFRRGLDRLLDSGVGVDVVTTDRAPSIRKIMRESYPELRHQFDPWHVAKGTITWALYTALLCEIFTFEPLHMKIKHAKTLNN